MTVRVSQLRVLRRWHIGVLLACVGLAASAFGAASTADTRSPCATPWGRKAASTCCLPTAWPRLGEWSATASPSKFPRARTRFPTEPCAKAAPPSPTRTEAGPPVHFAFDSKGFEFRRLASTVRVELGDYGLLGGLVRELGAVSAKAYPQLGFALIRLRPAADPAQAAQRLAELSGVRSANVRFKNRTHRPRPPRPALLDPSGNGPDLPTVRAGLKADLYVFFDGLRVADDGALTASVAVLNWGAANSRAARVTLDVTTDPAFGNVVDSSEARVPILGPKESYSLTMPIDTTGLANATYYVLVRTPPQSTELAGRSYTNEDRGGFTLDGAGNLRLECLDPGRGRSGADPLYRQQWHLNNTGQSAYSDSYGRPDADLSLNRILSRGPTGEGVRVAVVDTGLETCHPDLGANVEVGASFNFNAGLLGATLSTAPWPGARADDPYTPYPAGDHGTSVAGLIAATARNGTGGRGVAHGAQLRGYNMLNAIDYDLRVFLDSLGASHFAPDSSSVDVFNMSFGGFGYPSNVPVEEEALFAYGVRRLRNGNGAIYVKAAGNGFNNCSALSRHSVTRSTGCTSANGDATNNLPYVLVVGGMNATGTRASYASVGSNLWVTAPAGEYGFAKPAMLTTDQAGSAAGYGVVYGDRLSQVPRVNPDHDYTSSFNGTSSSAPNVSGVVAILLESVPTLTWREVKHVLASTARRVDSRIAVSNPEFGGVERTVRHAWTRNGAGYYFHNWYGFGSVRADRALEAAQELAPGTLGAFRRSGWFDASTPSTPIPDNNGTGIAQTLKVAGLPAFSNIEAVVLEVGPRPPLPPRPRHRTRLPLRHPKHPQPGLQRSARLRPHRRPTLALAPAKQRLLRRSTQRRLETHRVRWGSGRNRRSGGMAAALLLRRPPGAAGGLARVEGYALRDFAEVNRRQQARRMGRRQAKPHCDRVAKRVDLATNAYGSNRQAPSRISRGWPQIEHEIPR